MFSDETVDFVAKYGYTISILILFAIYKFKVIFIDHKKDNDETSD